MTVDVIAWLRDVCRAYEVAPVAVFQKKGSLEWPITIGGEEQLYTTLNRGGHFLPLPKEPAALANILEVSICDFLMKHLDDVSGVAYARGKERHYPDLEVTGEAVDGAFYAVDIKVARRAKGGKRTDSRITLYTGNTYFRYPQLHWPGTFRPFDDYAQHIDVVALYDLNEHEVHRIDNLQLLVQEPWRIGSKKRSSTTREYIGAVDAIADLINGKGEFATKQEFYAYWRKHPFKIGRVVQRQLDKLLKTQNTAHSR